MHDPIDLRFTPQRGKAIAAAYLQSAVALPGATAFGCELLEAARRRAS